MKCIHSFWFKGIQESGLTDWAGYPDEHYFWYAWAFSLARANRFGGSVELYTDSFGAEQIGHLGFRYEKIHTIFDQLSPLPKEFWAYPKLLVYSLQQEPFFHIDTDFIFVSPLEERFLSADLVVQSVESLDKHVVFYLALHKAMVQNLKHLPENYHQLLPGDEDLFALNCGIFGGQNLTFIHNYAKECMEIYHHPENRHGWETLSLEKENYLPHFNSAIEQLNLAYRCRSLGIAPLPLHTPEEELAVEEGLVKPRFAHLVGNSKSHAGNLHSLKRRMERSYPEAKERIDTLVHERKRRRSPHSTKQQKIDRALHTFRFPKHAYNDPKAFSAGFLEPRYFWYSWALASYSLTTYFRETALYSDKLGREIAIDLLQFPYSEVHPLHKELELCPSEFWNLPKFFTYRDQEKPFLHLDVDAFFGLRPTERMLGAEVLGQHGEIGDKYAPFYQEALKLLKEHIPFLPDFFYQIDETFSGVYAMNCGVLGGLNIELLKAYAHESIEILLSPRNKSGWDALFQLGVDATGKAIIAVEQLNILRWCQHHRCSPQLVSQFDIPRYEQGLLNFNHLWGGQKKDQEALDKVEHQITSEHPEVKKRIDEYLGG